MASYSLPNAIDLRFFFLGGGGGQFSDIGFKASELGICTYTGKWEYIKWVRKTSAILVTLSLSLCTNMYIIVSSHFDISTILLLLLRC